MDPKELRNSTRHYGMGAQKGEGGTYFLELPFLEGILFSIHHKEVEHEFNERITGKVNE